MTQDLDLMVQQHKLIVDQLLYPNKRKFLRKRHKRMLFWAKSQLNKGICNAHINSTVMGVYKMVEAKINYGKN